MSFTVHVHGTDARQPDPQPVAKRRHAPTHLYFDAAPAAIIFDAGLRMKAQLAASAFIAAHPGQWLTQEQIDQAVGHPVGPVLGLMLGAGAPRARAAYFPDPTGAQPRIRKWRWDANP